ncbi:MAG: hypothetical protein WCA15_14255 [Candidatus Acidiferrales bacterium]
MNSLRKKSKARLQGLKPKRKDTAGGGAEAPPFLSFRKLLHKRVMMGQVLRGSEKQIPRFARDDTRFTFFAHDKAVA